MPLKHKLDLKLSAAVFWILLSQIRYTSCACTWPAVFQSSTWRDSAKGELVFTTNELTGYVNAGYQSTTYTQWICQEETFSTDGVILARSKTSEYGLAGQWYAYICLKFTQVTSVSYIYYIQNAQEQNTAQYRQYITPYDDRTIAQACNQAAGSSGSEFVTVIKKGSESSAYITCPSVLHGRFEFNYTNSAGTTSCTGPSEHMNVCTDKSQLAFDVPCSTTSIVYATGSVYCVASVTSGSDTFVQLYNNQGSVDSSTTYRFSCMAISSDSRQATIVYKNCTNHQTSTNKARRYDGVVIGASISFSPYVFCKGGCTWPEPFLSSTWRDNTRGDLTFGVDKVTGWTFSPPGYTVANWECLDNSSFASDGTLLLKSTDTFVSGGQTYISYLCLSTTKVTDNSYYYYQSHDQDSKGGYERGKFSTDGFLTNKADICSATQTVPAAEFHFMILPGTESDSRQFCPPSLLARMDYTHTSATGVVTCASSTDDWDVCTNRTTMKFDYGTCGTQMAYSASGEVYCMVNLTISSYDYVVVFNTDPSPTYRFACIVSDSGGTTASVVYNNCSVDQTPTSYAKQANGTSIGYLVTMTATETCPFLLPTTTTTSTTSTTTTTTTFTTQSTTSAAQSATNAPSSTTTSAVPSGGSTDGGGGSSPLPVVAGAVVGLLLLALIAAITIYCLKRKKKRAVENGNFVEKRQLPNDIRNGHTGNMNVEDLDNPALTVHPEKHTLTPLPPKDGFGSSLPQALPPIGNHV